MVVHVNDTGSDATTYTDTDVAEDVEYTYRVKAINSNGVGNQSRATSIWRSPRYWGLPGSPQVTRNLEATQVNDGLERHGMELRAPLRGIELTWDAPYVGEVTGYQILRRLPEECEYGYRVHVENTNNTDTNWTDTNVEIGTLYDYQVRAINDVGVGRLVSVSREFSASVRPREVVSRLGWVMLMLQGDLVITPGMRNVMELSIASLKLDDDPDTVDYTVRGDVTLDADGSYSNACEGDGLGEDLEFTVIEASGTVGGSVEFEATFGGPGCNAGTYTLTFVLRDRDGQEIGTYTFPKEVVGRNEEIVHGEDFGISNYLADGIPVVTGTARVGETLTADTSGISDEDGLDNAAFSYQWLADDTAIAGATGASYTLTDSDEGKAAKVRVSFTDDAGNDETLTSEATDTVQAPSAENVPATGVPTIGGDAQVGETLTADTSGISDEDGLDNAAFSYQWLADDTAIAGATGASYTLTDSDEGKAAKVRVSFTDDVGNSESLTSAATEAVTFAVQQQTANTPATGAPTISGYLQVGKTLTAHTSTQSRWE